MHRSGENENVYLHFVFMLFNYFGCSEYRVLVPVICQPKGIFISPNYPY